MIRKNTDLMNSLFDLFMDRTDEQRTSVIFHVIEFYPMKVNLRYQDNNN